MTVKMAASLVKSGFRNLFRNFRRQHSLKQCHGMSAVAKNRVHLCPIKYCNRFLINSFVSSVRQYSVTTYLDRKCWKCNAPTNAQTELFFCNCGVVQNVPSDLSYFKTFNLPESFDIDTSKLPDLYKELQRNLHPDKFSQKSKEEQQIAANQSAFINKAYGTLMKPLDRGLYILNLKGMPLSERESDVDPEFLIDVMDINEAIIENKKDPSVLREIEKENTERVEQCVKKISSAFVANDTDTAKEILIYLKYFSNIDQKLKDIFRNKFERH